MTPNPWLLILIPAAYLAGSIPFGLLVGLRRGIDPRKAGSGNIGATNVGRLLGGRYFALVFILDLLKGFVPTATAGAIIHLHRSFTALDLLLWLLVGTAAILGHVFSLFLGLKGGKGVATSGGVILGIFPYYTLPMLIASLAWGIVFRQTRYVSLASIVACAVFPVAYAGLGIALGWPLLATQLPLLLFAVIIPVLIVYKHRGNIARLRAGTENRFAKTG